MGAKFLLKRKIFILTIVLVSLLSLSMVSAGDNATADTIGIGDSDNEIVNIDDNQATLTDEGSLGDFRELSQLIENTSETNTLKLEKNYRNNQSSGKIIIDKAMTIDGQGHFIDANHFSEIFFINAPQVTLKNIKFVNADYYSSGAAIDLAPNSDLTIDNSSFVNCSASVGGAIYVGENSILSLTNSNFTNCHADSGGAIYFETGSSSTIINSNFNYNVALVMGGSLFAKGGNDLTLFKTSFVNSSATHESGGAFALIQSNLNAQYMRVIDCTSVFGGAITLLSTNSTISHSTFKRNSARYDGGAILAIYDLFNLDDNNFTDNSAKRGGALYVSRTNNTVISNRFENNLASLGGAIYEMVSNDIAIDGNAGLQNNLYQTVNDNLTITSLDFNSFVFNEIIYPELPEFYSMRDDNLLTPVKDQGTEGNCWAFTAMAVLESCIKKASDLTLDLSEANLKNIMAMYSDYGYNVLTNDGGFPNMVFAYLASWLGPIYDDDDFYSINDYLSPLLSNILHIQNILFIDRESILDNEAIKKAILKYGAVATGMHYDDEYLKSISYYYDGDENPDHAVAIVGWDDHYSKYNFKNVPAGDGAWIVRNSWGPSWGGGGYFYVSYYDTKVAEVNGTHSYTFILNDTVALNRIYQHEIQFTSRLTPVIGSNEVYYKNMFTVEGEENLAAVSTYFLESCDYHVNIYVNDILTGSKSGSADMGYYTIYLDNMIGLHKDDNVTVEFCCENFASGVGQIPCSIKSSVANLYIKEGVSFYWNGYQWIDFYSGGAVACIKMFTTFSAQGKVTPYFQASSEKDVGDNSYIITITLPRDATGFVSISINGKDEIINISTTKSIRLYGLDESNNTLLLNYSGDDKYFGSVINYVVDLNSDKANFEELASKIYNLDDGDVLNLTKDYYYLSGSTEGIYIINSITIDGNGHTINANNQSVIFNVYANNTVLKNIKFVAANGQYGGAIYLYASGCQLINCSFIDNFASDVAGAIYLIGSDCSIVDCSFVNNSAGSAGAIYGYGDHCLIDNCSFVDNSANYGAAVRLSGANTVLNNCEFIGNVASIDGGAIYSSGNEISFTNLRFINNSASRNGGAFYLFGENCNLTNSTFDNNSGNLQVIWNVESGNIDGCYFIDSPNNNIYNKGGNLVKNYIDVVCTNTTFDYKNPSTLLLYVNNSYVPALTFRIGNGNKKITTDDISLVYDELAKLGIGTWNLQVSFSEDDSYYSYSNSFTLNVVPAFSSINASAGDGTVGHQITITATVLDFNGSSVNEGTVTFMEGDNPIGTVNVENGVASLSYTPSMAGNHLITAIFSSSNYRSSNSSFELFSDDISVKISAEPGVVGVNSTFYVTVTAVHSPVNDGSVSFYLGGNFIGKKAIVDGHANLTYVPLTAGNYTLKVVYGESQTFSNKENETGFSISKAPSSTVLTQVNGTVGREMILTVAVTSNAIVSDGKITFLDGSEIIGVANVDNGIATFKYTPKAGGKHQITATYSGNNYEDSSDSVEVYVDDVNITISLAEGMVGFNSTISVIVTPLYSSVADGSITFYLNGELIGKQTIVHGNANLIYLPLAAGNHTLKVVFADSQAFSNKQASANYTVKPADSQIIIDRTEGVVGSDLTLTAHVSSSNHQIITGGKVIFYDDGDMIGSADVKGGIASLPYTTTRSGNHVISVKFVSNDYDLSQNDVTIFIDKTGTEMAIDDANLCYDTSSAISISITSNGKAVNEGSVRIFVNGQQIGDLDVADGQVIFEYRPVSLDALNITAVFDGTANYLSSNSTKMLSINKLATKLAASGITEFYNDGKYLIVTLKDNNNKPLNGQKIAINLNGVKYLITDAKGQVKLPTASLKPKTYNVAITFAGTGSYLKSTMNVKVTVKKATPKMTAAKKKTFKRKVKVKKYTITLKNNKNKAMAKVKVFIKVNGKSFSAKTSSSGKATFKIKKLTKKSKYTATVTYKGDACYNKVSKKVKIIVK